MMTPNKKPLLALCAAIVMGSTIPSAFAADNGPSQQISQNDQIGKDWMIMQQVNGITVSYSVEVLGQERFLSVKFENTNVEAVDFIWSMTKNNTSIQITADEMIESRIQLTSSASEIIDGTYLIELTDGDQLSDFIVSIQPTKH